jgi:murein DD-endopeptidase MepM/ murein hydrolase activator NlpD
MRLRSLLVIISIILLPVFGALSLNAQTADELKANLDTLSAKIEALDKEIAEYNKKISTTQGEAKTLKAALASLEARRAGLEKEIQSTTLKIQQTEGQIEVTKEKIGLTENKLDKNKSALAETLRSLVYQDQSVPPFIRTLSNGARLSDMMEELKRSSDVSHSISDKVDTLQTTKQELSTQKTSYESSKKRLENLSATLTDQKQLVLATTKEKSTLLVQTNNKETEYQKLVADRKIKKDSLEAEMLSVESKLKAFTDVSSLPKTGKGVLHYPVTSINLTQYFGDTAFSTANPQVYNGHGHNGIDLAVKVGTPVMAAADGVVMGTGNTDTACSGVSYGKWVLIRHSNGLSTLYAHLSVIQATAGQTVKVGDKIGLSGNTGYSTGPHVHFTVYATDAVHIAGPTEYKSKVCGTYLIMPLAPVSGYLNPLSYL